MNNKNKFPYTEVQNDNYGVRNYTLENGLKVFLAKNDEAPKIQTYIAVKTGSNRDPKDNTGLAHYLEHMMFKGTSKIGSANWEKEKVLLNEISDLYEQHKLESNPEKKKGIYQKIDEVSQEAAQYAIPNEYDKLMMSIGASGTNAHTWLDETIYKNTIPKNELEKWLMIEKERFSELTLRLFHTELESVYEEFNRAQDNDGRLVNYALMELLFPNHPNGQQTTLGKAEHLKNPSMKAIHEYFDHFYVPNNMAVILVGDLDFDKTIALVDEYFGKFQSVDFPKKEEVEEKPLTAITSKTVKSPSQPRLQIAWRTDSFGTEQSRLAEICSQILSNNGEVGLIDININQKQKALRAGAFAYGFKKYGYFSMVIVPKENQSLKDAEKLLLSQIDLIKKGAFPDWLMNAILNDMKLQRMKSWETANGLATTLYDDFIKDRTWEEELQEMDLYAAITKEEIVKFANDFFRDNYVAVYKEQGENENLIRVDNPKITPIKINRQSESEFFKEINSFKTEEIKPEFIDYQRAILTDEIKNRKVSFVENSNSNLAQINLLFPFGKDHNRQLELAFTVMGYLGTSKYTPEDLKAEFYKLGITHNVQVSQDKISVMISGLEENILKATDLLFHYLDDLKPDDQIYKEVVSTILEARTYNKKDKNAILKALTNYAKFGAVSSKTDVISKEELLEISCEDVVNEINGILKFPFELFYYGKAFNLFKNHIENLLQEVLEKIPERKIYPEKETLGKTYFVEYDMVQSEMLRVGRSEKVNPYTFGEINVFNEYFGRGLSSVVFQELRESRSLAYSAYVSYSAASESEKHNYVTTYIGTQPDKLKQANNAIDELLADFPKIPNQFENAKQTMLKQIASGRINRQNIFFKHYNLLKLGIHHDLRKDIYETIKQLDFEKLKSFFDENISSVKFNNAIIGNKKEILNKNPELKDQLIQLNLEEIFGY